MILIPGESRVTALLKVLRTGDFSALIGEAEDSDFECKKIPYRLDTDIGQLELAKDVAAFANSGGGIIVLGLETESVVERAADVVRAVRVFPKDRFNGPQYYALLENQLFPRIEQLECIWHASGNDENNGLVSIVVPSQNENLQPFLVNRSQTDSGKVRGNMLGWFSRHRANVNHMDLRELHQFIRAGRLAMDIDSRLQGIENLIREFARPPDADVFSASGSVSSDEQTLRIKNAIHLANLSAQPAYVLTSSPLGAVELKQLFASRRSELAVLLEEPPSLRYGGFGIDAGGNALIVQGQLRRALDVQSRRDLELWRDGFLLFVGPGDQEFLCWSRRAPPPLVINSIVLIESILVFCLLVAEIQRRADPIDCGVRIGVELRGTAERSLSLGPGFPGSFAAHTTLHQAPKHEIRFEESWTGGAVDAPLVAYRLATRIYEWFGLSHDRIPFAEGEGESRRINQAAIVGLRG